MSYILDTSQSPPSIPHTVIRGRHQCILALFGRHRLKAGDC